MEWYNTMQIYHTREVKEPQTLVLSDIFDLGFQICSKIPELCLDLFFTGLVNNFIFLPPLHYL